MAGRNVGSISVTVDADTSKLKVQLVAAGEEGGEGAKEAIDDALGEIGGAQLKAAITRIRSQLEQGLSGVEAEVNAQVTEGSIARAAEEIEFALEGLEAAIAVGVQEGSLADTAEEIDSAVSNIQSEIDTNVRESSLAETVEEINAAVSHVAAEIDVQVNASQKAEADALLKSNFSQVGEESGKGFSDNFSKALGGGGGGGGGLSTRMQAIAAGIVLLMEPAAVALEGLASGAVQVLSSAFSALAGAGGALLPIMAGLGATLGAVVIGSVGLSDAFKAVNKEFTGSIVEGRAFNAEAQKIQVAIAGLAPAVQDVVRAFAQLRPQLAAIQEQISGQVFAGLGAQLKVLSKETIPDIGNALAQAGGTANRFAFELSSAFQGIDFAHTFAEISPALDSIGQAIANVVRTIQPFFEAVAPAARELGDMILRASQALLALVTAGNQSGNLTAFFNQSIDSLKVWGDLIANVGRALLTLFEAGTSGGNSLIQSLSNVIGRFNDWMNTIAGQSALEEFFDSGRRALSALTPLLQGAVGFFDNLVSQGAIDRFADLAANIGKVLPVLGQLFEIVGRVGVLDAFAQALAQIGEALQPAIPALQDLASAIGRGLTELISNAQPALETFGQFFADLATILTPLIPDIVDVGNALLEAFAPTLVANADAMIEIFTAIAPLITQLLQAAVPLIQIMGQLSQAFLFIETVLAKLEAFIISKVVSAFEFLSEKVQEFLDLLGEVPFLGAFLDFLGLTTDETQQTADAVDNLAASAEDLQPAVQDAANVIADAADAAERATTGTDLLEGSYADLKPAIDDAARAIEGDIEVSEKAAVATDKLVKAQNKLKISLAEAEDALFGMQTAFSRMERSGDALSAVFDLGNAPEDAATATRDILEGIADAKKALKDNKISAKDVIDVKTGEIKQTLKADPFLDAIDDLRPQIQAKLTESFALDPTGAAAQEQALNYIKQVTDALGGKFTPDQVAKMLGLDNFQQTITIAVELSQVAEAKAELEALVGIGGATPLTATIGLALDKGTLSGDAAQAILNELAIAQGIPAEVLPEVTPEGMEQARAFLAANPGLLPVDVKFPDPLPPVPTPAPVTVPVEFNIAASDVGVFLDSTAGPAGALTNFSQTVTIPIIADKSEYDTAVAQVHTSIGELDQTNASPTILTDTKIPTENVEGLIGELGVLNETTAAPAVSVPAYNDVFSQLADLNSSAMDFDSLTPDAVVSLSGYDTTIDNIDHIIDRANALDGKQIDIFFVQHGDKALAHGGIAGPGGALAGEAGPEVAFFGSSARLLTQPTRVAPGTVVVPLGGSTVSTVSDTPVIARQVNNYMTFQITNTDAAAVAQQVVNRSAAMASL